ncbi:hypothetical protein FEF34_03630 [Streptomyces marianii]|uniref:AMP-dependent synthetase/ligase domain-containing protein n=2 Tax=Streptomyces marianii TaxID=1817406 RepID=A0A5R9E0C2_9ACTN|nr:hypothetical protein FEF34_03630 [Streptomyces marianii]
MSFVEFLGTTAAGGTVVVPSPDRAKDPRHWAESAVRHGVTVWNSAPALTRRRRSCSVDRADRGRSSTATNTSAGVTPPSSAGRAMPTTIQAPEPKRPRDEMAESRAGGARPVRYVRAPRIRHAAASQQRYWMHGHDDHRTPRRGAAAPLPQPAARALAGAGRPRRGRR